MNQNTKKALSVFINPLILVSFMWVIKFVEIKLDISLEKLGIYPQRFNGMKGILFTHFIHASKGHLINNTFPLIFLGSMLFYFYKKTAWNILILLSVISGFWLWIIGRPSYHIGASGLIYGLASFLFTSGLIKKNTNLYAVSLLIVFLYGSMIWGVLPTHLPVSWEGHLSGFIAGILLAFIYKNEGPKKKKYNWEIEEEIEARNTEKITINYINKK